MYLNLDAHLIIINLLAFSFQMGLSPQLSVQRDELLLPALGANFFDALSKVNFRLSLSVIFRLAYIIN
jgi:hypothetical protein